MPNWKFSLENQRLELVNPAVSELGVFHHSGKVQLGVSAILDNKPAHAIVSAHFYSDKDRLMLLAVARPQKLFKLDPEGNGRYSFEFVDIVDPSSNFLSWLHQNSLEDDLFVDYEVSTAGVFENPFGTLKPKPTGANYRMFESDSAYWPPSSGQGAGRGVRKYAFTVQVTESSVPVTIDISCCGIKDFTNQQQILCCKVPISASMAQLPDGNSYSVSAAPEITWDEFSGPFTNCECP